MLNYKSLSVVGLAKNTGKTETLNFLLSQLKDSGKCVAVTSIGLDGEQTDQIFGTKKPEITIYKGMIFVTVERFFAEKTMPAEILNISEMPTTLGKIVTARALETGKVILSGAADTATLKKIIAQNAVLGADLTLVDGATSRLSLASPAVTEAMILATGAALSANMQELVRKTKFVCSLVALETVDETLKSRLQHIEKGLWGIDKAGELHDFGVTSSLVVNHFTEANKAILQQAEMIFCAGAVSDKLLNLLTIHKLNKTPFTLVAKDFTHLFVSPYAYSTFAKKGGCIKVLHHTQLLALTVNPTSPEGYVFDSEQLQEALRQEIDVKVFDVRKILHNL
ncbi:MAG: hypothetical protein LBV31_00740 [Prevotellaceae bacterium]|jgi:hypothetical protein|nr:hypothetical protein [Prevotellaceae bacterium]